MPPHTIDEMASSRPMSVEQIVKKAQSYDYNPLIALRYWLRTAGTLLKEVRSQLQSKNLPTDGYCTGRDLRT